MPRELDPFYRHVERIIQTDTGAFRASQPIMGPLSLSLEEDVSPFGLHLLAKPSTQLVQAARIVTLAVEWRLRLFQAHTASHLLHTPELYVSVAARLQHDHSRFIKRLTVVQFTCSSELGGAAETSKGGRWLSAAAVCWQGGATG